MPFPAKGSDVMYKLVEYKAYRARHLGKPFRGQSSLYDADAESRICLVFEVDEQRSDFVLVVAIGGPKGVEDSFLDTVRLR